MNPDQPPITQPLRFCGEPVSREQLVLITQIVTRCGGLSRTELANTVCELFDWARPNGKLKTVECRQFLERLQARSALPLPLPLCRVAGNGSALRACSCSRNCRHSTVLSLPLGRAQSNNSHTVLASSVRLSPPQCVTT